MLRFEWNTPPQKGREATIQASTYEKDRSLHNRMLGKVVYRRVSGPNQISSDEIERYGDPDLRAALQLAHAVETLGWITTGPGSSYVHHVGVDMTNGGAMKVCLYPEPHAIRGLVMLSWMI